jgi:hypothetical protein
MEPNTTHKPGEDQRCRCGAQEVFFEGYPLDPGDLGPVVGYGCDAEGHPYTNLLARRGWWVNKRHREVIARELSDEDWDALDDEDFKRVMDFINEHRPGWG